MRLTILHTLLLSLTFMLVQGQKLVTNPGVDTTTLANKIALTSLKKYLSAVEKGDDVTRFWRENNKYNKSKYTIDPSAYAFNGTIPIYKLTPHKTILSIETKNPIVIIKMIHNWLDSDKITTFCITNHYIDVNSGEGVMLYPEDVLTARWITHKVRNVNFTHPERVKFNRKTASRLIKAIVALKKEWNVLPKEINYFYSNDYHDINSIRGFDYIVGGSPKPQGITYYASDLIFSSGLGEGYFHEFVHVYLGFLTNKELEEGLAILYGGAIGLSLRSHVESAKEFLAANPEFIFEMANINYTATKSGISIRNLVLALICNESYRTQRVEGLKKIMSYLSFQEVLEKELNLTDGKRYDIYIKHLINNF